MKTEPSTFSIDDLKRKKKESWEGVRNYQARNYMRDYMKKGDMVLIYHSNADVIGVAGIAVIYKEAYPDHFAYDPKSKYYDANSDPNHPRWFMVDVQFIEKFKNIVSLDELKKHSALSGMLVIKKGMRLSVQPVLQQHFEYVVNLGNL